MSDDWMVPGFANLACRDLPPGWQLLLEMEQGSGGWSLTDPCGNVVDPEDYTSVDCSFLDQGRDAVLYAKKKAEETA